MARVAVVGLGRMGGPIARRLLAGGHDVVGYDLDAGRVAGAGVAAAASPADAAARADVVLLSLPTQPAVEAAALGRDGVAAAARPDLVLVDCSTSSPALARRLEAELDEAGVGFLDAPVSGGPGGAERGTLTVMVGGRDAVVARVLPVLEAFAGLVVHVGPAGAGQAAKLCNNLVVGTTMAAIAEACALGEGAGIPAATLYRVLRASTADSPVLRMHFPLPGADPAHPASRAFAASASVDVIEKDLELALELAADVGADAPVAAHAHAAFEAAQAAGFGTLDYSAVYSVKSQTLTFD